MTKEEAIKYLQQLYPNGGHCWLDEQRIEAIGMAVKALQDDPVSEDLEYASEKYSCRFSSSKYGHNKIKSAFKDGANWQKEQMMKNAVDAKVCAVFPLRNYNEVHYSVHYPIGVLPYKDGDKVKVIVIKEDRV